MITGAPNMIIKVITQDRKMISAAPARQGGRLP
jgi:hypothetical protein